MKFWRHRHYWIEKRHFCTELFSVIGYECKTCGERNVEKEKYGSPRAETWNAAFEWRDQAKRPAASVLKMVK